MRFGLDLFALTGGLILMGLVYFVYWVCFGVCVEFCISVGFFPRLLGDLFG